MRWLLLIALALVVLQPAPAHASTALPFTFADLVAQADTVVETTVIDVRSRFEIEGSRRRIVTDVHLVVAETLKGTLPRTAVVKFLGGRVGNEELVIAGAPRFVAGDHDVLFLALRDGILSPVLGMGQGRFRVTRDPRSGGEVVRQFDGTTLHSIADIGSVMRRRTLSLTRSVSVAEFKRDIRSVLSAQQGGAR